MATAFLVMAGNMRAALTQRDELVRPFRERYDRLRDDAQDATHEASEGR
jgi:hypothetical protein